jgi:hypothetical protein
MGIGSSPFSMSARTAWAPVVRGVLTGMARPSFAPRAHEAHLEAEVFKPLLRLDGAAEVLLLDRLFKSQEPKEWEAADALSIGGAVRLGSRRHDDLLSAPTRRSQEIGGMSGRVRRYGA